MFDEVTQSLADCLEAMEGKGATVEECLAQHPAQRASLSTLLAVASALQSAPAVAPTPAFRAQARRRLIAQLPPRRPAVRAQDRRSFRQTLAAVLSGRPLLARMMIAFAVVVMMGGGVVYASASALPNDIFYPVKIAIEQARLALSPGARGDAELHLTFAAERLNEVTRLIEVGRSAEAPISLDTFGVEVQAAVQLAQTASTSGDQEALVAQVSNSLSRYERILANIEQRLPPTAWSAAGRAREVVRSALSGVPARNRPGLPATTAPTTVTLTPTLTRTPMPTSPRTLTSTHLPTASATPVPPKLPTAEASPVPRRILTRVATAMPTDWLLTRVPTRWQTLIPTILPSRVPGAWLTRMPTIWPTGDPSSWPTAQPTWWPSSDSTPAPPDLPPDRPTRIPGGRRNP
jgi:hypothetical protein